MIKHMREPILPLEIMGSLKAEDSGSVVVHMGVVRPTSEGRKVVSMEYSADEHKMIEELSEIDREIRRRWGVEDVALCRRTGKLNLGEVILVAAVSAPHREEGFRACEFAVERMKKMFSITKRELFEFS